MKILVSAVTGLGDFIFKTPLIYELKNKYSNIEIDFLIGNSWGVDSIIDTEKEYNFNYIYLPSKKSFIALCKFFSSINKRYDYVILPYDSTDRNIKWAAIFFLNANIFLLHSVPKYRSLKSRIDGLLLNFISGEKIRLVPIVRGRHEIDANLDFTAHIFDMPYELCRRTKINPIAGNISGFNLGDEIIVIQPSAANGIMKAKVWSPDNFNNLIMRISDRYKSLKIVLVGDEGDIFGLGEHKILNNPAIINLMGKTSFSQLCELIRISRLVIAHDSGVAHIADSFNVNLIALYGPTDNSKTRVLGQNSKILYSRNETISLMYRTDLTEMQISHAYPEYYCMSGISVEAVFNEAIQILGDDQS